jgi:hypothetical protein
MNRCFPKILSLQPDLAKQIKQVELTCRGIRFYQWQHWLLDEPIYEKLQGDEEALKAKTAQVL